MQMSGASTHRRAPLWSDLTLLGIVGALLISALWAGGNTVYQQFYGPSAFVVRYLDLLSDGRAADALRLPGVSIDRNTLESAGIDASASDVLLRQAALAPLEDIEVVSETTEDSLTTVTVSYSADGHTGESSFTVRQDGWVGITPNWSFAETPLSAVTLIVRGADQFRVNGFEMDRRQVSAAGADAASLDPLPLLVFTPGLYSVSVDTPISTASGVAVLADAPGTNTPVDVQTQPTQAFIAKVQERVEEFLTQCTTQQILQPTGCPFGYPVRDRLDGLPQWSIAAQPTVTVSPDGGEWSIPLTSGTAHIEADVLRIYDRSRVHISQDVPFQVTGSITILADGSASIRVGSPGEGDALDDDE